MQTDVLIFVMAMGMAEAVLLSAALWTAKRKQKKANQLLAVFFLLLAVDIANGMLFAEQFMLEVPHFLRISTPLTFLYGPLLYLYVSMTTQPTAEWRRWNWLHGIPFMFCVLYFLPLYVQGAEAKVAYTLALYQGLSWDSYFIGGLRRVHQLVYLLLTAHLVIRHIRQSPRREGVAPQTVWLGVLTVAFGLVWSLGIYRYFFDFQLLVGILDTTCLAVFMLAAGYIGLRRPDLFSESNSVAKKQSISSLDGVQAEKDVEKLKHLMESDALHRDGRLTLPKLAKHMAMTPHALSQLLNMHLGCNFNDFVNQLRVEEARSALQRPDTQHLKIAEIAHQVGFNSLSTFNAAFKKFTGTTPSQHRKRSPVLDA